MGGAADGAKEVRGQDGGDKRRVGASRATSEEEQQVRYQRQQRTLRKKIEADPEAFFTQADADCSKDLSRDEWGKICRAFVEDVEHDPARALFEEIAQGRDTISRSFPHRCCALRIS